MAMISIQSPVFSKTLRNGTQRILSCKLRMVSAKPIPAGKEKGISRELQTLSIPENDSLIHSNIEFDRVQPAHQVAGQGNGVEFGQFVAREARLDEEYWNAAWLRAETHWEGREFDRYAESFKRKFAEQVRANACCCDEDVCVIRPNIGNASEFNTIKRRRNAQLGEKCKCVVMVRKEDINTKGTILKSVVGTLDLNIRYLSHKETFPGERVKPPMFCLTDRKESSRYAYVSNVCVAKSARRQGIASEMLQFAILCAKLEYGVGKVFVHVHRDNEPAQRLYEKMGFQVCFDVITPKVKVVDAATSQLRADQTYLLCLQVSNYLPHSFSNL